MDSFTVEYHPHGMAVRGSVPLSALGGIVKLAADRDPTWTLMHPGVAHALGVLLAIGSEESLAAWKAEIDASVAKVEPDLIRRWKNGTGTGLSSRWLLACILGETSAVEPGYPRDAGDFERCSRMLDATGLRPRLSEAGPQWASYLAEWDHLEALLATGERTTIYAILRSLNNYHGR